MKDVAWVFSGFQTHSDRRGLGRKLCGVSPGWEGMQGG